jgi:hypothetical protein
MSSYDNEEAMSNWEGFDFTDRTDRSVIMDISQTFDYMLGESRTKRRRKKLREELVREHVEGKQPPAPFLKNICLKLFGLKS